MKNTHFSYLWFKTQTAFRTKSVQAFTDAFAWLGFEPQIIRNDFTANQKIVVAQILALKPHPQKTNLTVCQVDTGLHGQYQVVCGAQNLTLHAKVIFALPKAILFNGIKISKANFAGMRSNGMICALDELIPFQSRTNQIVILPSSAELGSLNPLQYLTLADVIWKLEFTFQTRHLSNYFGLTTYLAQYWKLPLNDLPFFPPFQTLKAPFPFPTKKTALLLLIKTTKSLNLPLPMIDTLKRLKLFTNNFTADLSAYFYLFSGCKLEFKPLKATTETWTEQLTTTNQAFLLRIPEVFGLNKLPPVYRFITFAHLSRLFNQLQVDLVANVTKLPFPIRQIIILDPAELIRISGQKWTFSAVKKLFDLTTWKIVQKKQVWHFTLPLTHCLNDQFELIGEILRLSGYQNLPSQPLFPTDLPNQQPDNSILQTALKFTAFWKAGAFIEARIPLLIQKPSFTNPYYQLEETFLPYLVALTTKFARPLFALDTIWENKQEKQLFAAVLPPLKTNELLQQRETQATFLQLVKKLILEFDLSPLKLQLPPFTLLKQSNPSLVNIISYQTKNGFQPLAQLGLKRTTTQRDQVMLVPYLTLDYTLFVQITKQTTSNNKYLPLLSQDQMQQQFAWFDLTLNFAALLQLYPVKTLKGQTFKFDLLQLLAQTVLLADKRIVNVKILDIYKQHRLTIRVVWKITDPKAKGAIQAKLTVKVKNCLKFLKNVKI